MEQSELLRFTVRHLHVLGISYAIVGSWGSSVYGEARFTNDIDVVLALPEPLIADFCAGFPSPEFDLSHPSVREAVKHRFQFNVLHPESGGGLNVR